VGEINLQLQPVPPFRLDLTAWALRRRPDNIIDRWDGECYRRALALGNGAVEVAITQSGSPQAPRLQVTVSGLGAHPGGGHCRGTACRAPTADEAIRAAIERMLGPRINLADFYRLAARDRRLGPLAERFRGVKPPRFPSLFEALVNAIACQQLSLTVGIILLNRLAQAYGPSPQVEGLCAHAFPRPQELLRAGPQKLRHIGLSRQKIRSLRELSSYAAEQRAELDRLERSDDETALAGLLKLRGIGRWSAEYALLRGMGRLHVFPGDDVGARNRLARWLGLKAPISYDQVEAALARWQPYAGLVYFHMLLSGLAEAGYLGHGDSPL